MKSFMVQISNTTRSIASIIELVLKRHAMHFHFCGLNEIVEKMPRVTQLEPHLPAATETASGNCWDRRRDLTYP